jgi:hypothetical protein
LSVVANDLVRGILLPAVNRSSIGSYARNASENTIMTDTLPCKDRETLTGHLLETFYRIMPSGETARALVSTIPVIVNMGIDDLSGDELKPEVERSFTYRSKLILLISMTRQKLIQQGLLALEAGFISGSFVLANQTINQQKSLLDQLDGVIAKILAWKRPISLSFIDSELDERTDRSAQDGCHGISRRLRWH